MDKISVKKILTPEDLKYVEIDMARLHGQVRDALRGTEKGADTYHEVIGAGPDDAARLLIECSDHCIQYARSVQKGDKESQYFLAGIVLRIMEFTKLSTYSVNPILNMDLVITSQEQASLLKAFNELKDSHEAQLKVSASKDLELTANAQRISALSQQVRKLQGEVAEKDSTIQILRDARDALWAKCRNMQKRATRQKNNYGIQASTVVPMLKDFIINTKDEIANQVDNISGILACILEEFEAKVVEAAKKDAAEAETEVVAPKVVEPKVTVPPAPLNCSSVLDKHLLDLDPDDSSCIAVAIGVPADNSVCRIHLDMLCRLLHSLQEVATTGTTNIVGPKGLRSTAADILSLYPRTGNRAVRNLPDTHTRAVLPPVLNDIRSHHNADALRRLEGIKAGDIVEELRYIYQASPCDPCSTVAK